MKISKISLLMVLLLSCYTLTGQVRRPRNDPGGRSASKLSESHADANQQMRQDNRIRYLTALAKASSEITPHPPETVAWCKELFVFASQMHDPRYREQGKKNALMYWSSVDPVLASQRLREVDNPPAESGQIHSEDVRADAAVEIFVNFWDRFGAESLPEIKKTATYLGSTGQYPYRAVGALLDHFARIPNGSNRALAESIHIEANNLFNEAFESYGRETGFQNREEEFLSLITSSGLALVDCVRVKPALHSYVENLLNPGDNAQPHYYAQVFVERGSIVPFSNRNRAFLFLAGPVIRRCDSEFADALIKQYSELSESSQNKMYYISGGLFFGNPSEAGRQHIKWLQKSIVDKIDELNNSDEKSDPETILRMANQLTDRSMRIVGLSGAVSALVATNRAKAMQIYQDQVADARNLSDPQENILATVALARAAHSLGKDDARNDFIRKALESAEGILTQESRPSGSVQKLLTQLVKTGTEAGMSSQVQETLKSAPPTLKAYLLIAEADGLTKQSNDNRASIAKK